jgi:hypothetical protein
MGLITVRQGNLAGTPQKRSKRTGGNGRSPGDERSGWSAAALSAYVMHWTDILLVLLNHPSIINKE